MPNNKLIALTSVSLLIAAGLLALSGCSSAGQAAPTPTPWPTEVVVQQSTYAVQRGTVVDTFTLDGRVSPVQWEPMFFKVDGKLSNLAVAEGASVKQGDLLAELDSKVLSDQLSQAKLSLEQVQNQMQQQEATKKYALEKAQLTLQSQQLALEKIRRQRDQGTNLALEQAQAELERARVALQRAQAAYNAVAGRPDIAATSQSAALQSATIDYNLAETKYGMAKQNDVDIQYAQQQIQVRLAELAVQELLDKSTSQSDVDKAKIAVQALERQIEERRLRAPFDGLVTAIGVNLQGLTRGFSQRPKVGDNIPAYSALVVVARPQPLEITIDGNQKRVPELFINQPVTVTHSAWARPFEAKITELPVAMSNSGNQPVSSQAVRIALPASAPPMSNGDPVRVYVQADAHPDTLFLPPIAVRHFAGRDFVIIQEGERQRRVDVKMGLQSEAQIEILSGLTQGDLVIAQ